MFGVVMYRDFVYLKLIIKNRHEHARIDLKMGKI